MNKTEKLKLRDFLIENWLKYEENLDMSNKQKKQMKNQLYMDIGENPLKFIDIKNKIKLMNTNKQEIAENIDNDYISKEILEATEMCSKYNTKLMSNKSFKEEVYNTREQLKDTGRVLLTGYEVFVFKTKLILHIENGDSFTSKEKTEGLLMLLKNTELMVVKDKILVELKQFGDRMGMDIDNMNNMIDEKLVGIYGK
tara:strand:+ start:444 stop:1037 length:594 start_codon:yes stop_codon:yes gene_type:complete